MEEAHDESAGHGSRADGGGTGVPSSASTSDVPYPRPRDRARPELAALRADLPERLGVPRPTPPRSPPHEPPSFPGRRRFARHAARPPGHRLRGSNKADENLRAETIDVGSTAGAAALQARANGTPIKTIGVYARPEWTALVVPKDSDVTKVTQLKGRRIAATKGTDPYFFLLQALQEAGLKGTDVEVVDLQHADGRTALERGDVDAWAGLDPLMAQSQVDAGTKLVYRNPAFNSYGFLNAREKFLTHQPDLARKVIDVYERARVWIGEHPDEAVELLASEAELAPEVAAVVLKERTEVEVGPVPGDEQRAMLERILPMLVREGQVPSEQEARTALDTLFAPDFR